MEKARQFISKIFTHPNAAYELAAENNIHIVEENLGEQIAGYFIHAYGEKLIHVNSEIQSYCKTFVIAYFLRYYPNKRTQNEQISLLATKHLAHLHTLAHKKAQ